MPKAPRPVPGGKIEIGPLDVAPDESLVNGSGLRKAFPAPSGVAEEEISKVPEPASIGFGLLGLLAILRRRQK